MMIDTWLEVGEVNRETITREFHKMVVLEKNRTFFLHLEHRKHDGAVACLVLVVKVWTGGTIWWYYIYLNGAYLNICHRNSDRVADRLATLRLWRGESMLKACLIISIYDVYPTTVALCQTTLSLSNICASYQWILMIIAMSVPFSMHGRFSQ